MGCCQSNTSTTADQVCLYPSNQLSEKQESNLDDFPTYEVSTNLFLKVSESSRGEFNDFFLSYYSVGLKLRTFDLGERFICIHQSTNCVRELIQLTKSQISQTILDLVFEKACILVNVTHKNLLKLHYAGENESFVNLVTDRYEDTLENHIMANLIDADTAVQYLQQILRGIEQYHEAGVRLCRFTLQEICFIEGTVKISPLVIIPFNSSETPSNILESSSEMKERLSLTQSSNKEIAMAAAIFLSMITAKPTVVDIPETLKQLQESSLHSQDMAMLTRIFSESGPWVSYEELLDYNWKLSLPLVYKIKKSQLESLMEIQDEFPEVKILQESPENNEELVVENRLELLWNSLSGLRPGHQDSSLNANLIEDQFFEKEGDREQVENEFRGLDWQDQGELIEAQIPIADFLQESMNEIFESIPEHEADSIEEFKVTYNAEIKDEYTKNPFERPILNLHSACLEIERISNENPLDRVTVDGLAFTEKSSLQFSLSDSPVFDDRDIKDFDYPLTSLPQIDQASLELSSQDEIFESEKDRESRRSIDGQTGILERPEELRECFPPATGQERFTSISLFGMAKDCLEQNEELEGSYPSKAMKENLAFTSPFRMTEECNSENSVTGELMSINSLETSPQDINSAHVRDIQHIERREYRSESLTSPKLMSRLSRVSLTNEIVLAENTTGKLKFYSFKNRYGFILWDRDASDIFLCEDDLILSGVNLKSIKKAITKKIEMKLQFTVLKYIRDGKDARKAVNLKIRE